MADLYRAAGADPIMSVDLHASQEQGVFDGPVEHHFLEFLLKQLYLYLQLKLKYLLLQDTYLHLLK